MKERKIGFVKISNAMIENTDVKSLSEITKDLFVVKAEQNYVTDSIEIYALSELFDPVPLGELIPEYYCKVTVNDERQIVNVEYSKIIKRGDIDGYSIGPQVKK